MTIIHTNCHQVYGRLFEGRKAAIENKWTDLKTNVIACNAPGGWGRWGGGGGGGGNGGGGGVWGLK